MRLVAALLVACLFAGCAGGSRLSESEAEAAARDAVEQFAEDLSGDGGGMRSVRGTLEGGSGLGGVSGASFEIEWGLDGARRFNAEAGEGDEAFSIAYYCTATSTIIEMTGQEAREARPRTSDGACVGRPLDESESLVATESMNATSVEAHSDGSVTAHFDTSDGAVTVEVDPKGRLESMEFSGDGASGEFHVDYSDRRAIDVPEADMRVPADVEFESEFDEGSATYTVDEAPESPPLAELELRVMSGGSQVAAFPMEAGEAPQAGFSYTYVDSDGDGRMTPGDRFSIEKDGHSFDESSIVVYDEWAQAEVGSALAPGPGFLAGLAVLGAVAFALRRRRA